MSDEKISALTDASTAQSGDELVIARSGANYKLSMTELLAAIPIVRGSVQGNGTIVSGTGFSVNRTSTGHYTITFSPTLSAAPVVVVTAWSGGNAVNGASANGSVQGAPSTSQFKVLTADGASTGYLDTGFDFIAIVP